MVEDGGKFGGGSCDGEVHRIISKKHKVMAWAELPFWLVVFWNYELKSDLKSDFCEDFVSILGT
jgi:hypothetical protein